MSTSVATVAKAPASDTITILVNPQGAIDRFITEDCPDLPADVRSVLLSSAEYISRSRLRVVEETVIQGRALNRVFEALRPYDDSKGLFEIYLERLGISVRTARNQRALADMANEMCGDTADGQLAASVLFNSTIPITALYELARKIYTPEQRFEFVRQLERSADTLDESSAKDIIASLRSTLSSQQEETEDARTELLESERIRRQQESEIAQLNNTHRMMSAAAEQVRSRVTALEAQLRDMQLNSDELHQQLHAANNRPARIEPKEVIPGEDVIKQRLADLNAEMHDVESRLVEARRTEKEATRRAAEASARLVETQSLTDEFASAHETLEAFAALCTRARAFAASDVPRGELAVAIKRTQALINAVSEDLATLLKVCNNTSTEV